MGYLDQQPEFKENYDQKIEVSYDNNPNIALSKLAQQRHPDNKTQQIQFIKDTAKSLLQYLSNLDNKLTVGKLWEIINDNNCNKIKYTKGTGIEFIGINGQTIDLEKAVLKSKIDERKQEQLLSLKQDRAAFMKNIINN